MKWVDHLTDLEGALLIRVMAMIHLKGSMFDAGLSGFPLVAFVRSAERSNLTKKNDQTPDYYKGSRTPEHATPFEFFEMLNRKFKFTLDPCATDQNAKCDYYFTKDQDGLSRSWKSQTVFMNPPYGRVIVDWVKKAYAESRDPNTVVVGLLPAKTDTRWFHNWVLGKSYIQLWKGRLKFGDSDNSAPFGSMIVIWGLNFVDQNFRTVYQNLQ